MHFVEGLAGDRVAVVAKVHHALADGVASANLIARALDPNVIDDDLDPPLPPVSTPGTGELLRAAARDHLDQLRQLPGLVRATAAGVSGSADVPASAVPSPAWHATSTRRKRS